MVAQNTARTAIRADDCVAADASLVRAFDLLGKRWTGVLLGTLSSGPVGFRALARAVPGISDSVLSDRLGELTEAGVMVPKMAQKTAKNAVNLADSACSKAPFSCYNSLYLLVP